MVSGACAISRASTPCGDPIWVGGCSDAGLRGVVAGEGFGREGERGELPLACFLDRVDALK